MKYNLSSIEERIGAVARSQTNHHIGDCSNHCRLDGVLGHAAERRGRKIPLYAMQSDVIDVGEVETCDKWQGIMSMHSSCTMLPEPCAEKP